MFHKYCFLTICLQLTTWTLTLLSSWMSLQFNLWAQIYVHENGQCLCPWKLHSVTLMKKDKYIIYCLWVGCLCVDFVCVCVCRFLKNWQLYKKLNLDVSVLQTCTVLWSPVWITKVSCSWAETAGTISPSAAQCPRDVMGPRKVKDRKEKNISVCFLT